MYGEIQAIGSNRRLMDDRAVTDIVALIGNVLHRVVVDWDAALSVVAHGLKAGEAFLLEIESEKRGTPVIVSRDKDGRVAEVIAPLRMLSKGRIQKPEDCKL